MSNISKHIHELLFEHDCVIIPGFGGFVANYLPARLDESNNRIFPPSKHLLFNKNLVNNDGLLAHRVSSAEGFSYDVALEKLSNYANQIKLSISKENRFEFPDIGLLYIKENTYQFKSSGNNFLMSSFGLPVLDAVPFSNNEYIEDKESEETPVINLQEHQQNKSKRKFKYWWVAAVLIPIVFYSVWIPMKTDLFKTGGEFHYSDLNPFSFRKDRVYEYNSLVSCVVFNPIVKNEVSELIVASSPDAQYGEYQLDDSELFLTVKLFDKQKDKAEAESTYVDIDRKEIIANNKTSKKYFLIGGCFEKQKNADNFINKLHSLGYDAKEVDIHNGLHRISINGYSTRKIAKAARKEILEKEGLSTWILKKK